MKRQKKKYSRPQRPFDKVRIEEENVLKDKYGLKNKREIWKADAAIGRIRNLAKQLITASDEEKILFVERLHKKGFKVEGISDALALNKEDWLKRRLQTIMLNKGFTTTSKQARQLIAHKHVSIGNQVVNIPSYQVGLEEEPLVKLDIVLKLEKPKSKEQEIKEEILNKDEEFAKKTIDKENKDIGSSIEGTDKESSGSEPAQNESQEVNKSSPEKLGDTKTRNAKSEEENKEDEKTE